MYEFNSSNCIVACSVEENFSFANTSDSACASGDMITGVKCIGIYMYIYRDLENKCLFNKSIKILSL
jgi:hypothetical protein